MNQTCPPEKWEKEEDKIVEKMSKYPISNSSFNWTRSTCPNCGKENWIEMMKDPEACNCFKCKKTFWISEKIYEELKTSLVMANVFNLDDIRNEEFIIDGKEKPN